MQSAEKPRYEFSITVLRSTCEYCALVIGFPEGGGGGTPG